MICIYVYKKGDAENWDSDSFVPKEIGGKTCHVRENQEDCLFSILLEYSLVASYLEGVENVVNKKGAADNRNIHIEELRDRIRGLRNALEKDLISAFAKGRDVSGEEISIFMHRRGNGFRDYNEALGSVFDEMRTIKLNLFAISHGEGMGYNKGLMSSDGKKISPPFTVKGVRDALHELYEHFKFEYKDSNEQVRRERALNVDCAPQKKASVQTNNSDLTILEPEKSALGISTKALPGIFAVFMGLVVFVVVAGCVCSWALGFLARSAGERVVLSSLALVFTFLLIALFYAIGKVCHQSHVLGEFIRQFNKCTDETVRAEYWKQYLDQLMRVWRGQTFEG